MVNRKLNLRLRGTAFALALILFALAFVWAVGMLSGRFTRFDMSSQGYFTLTEESREILSGLDEDVELILLAVEGSEDLTIQYLLQRYADASRHITLRTVDPATESELAAEYAPGLRYSNSVAVVSGERKCLVDLQEIYQSDYSAYMESGDPNDVMSVFRAESAVSGAIRYVTEDNLPRLYLLTGHGETALSDTVSRSLRAEGIVTAELDLSAQDVPEDADALMLHAPAYDISAAEREKLAAYLAGGGELILITAYSGEAMPELLALMEPYGCSLAEGLVVEQDREHYAYGYYDCLLPIVEEHELTAEIGEGSIVMPGSQAILSEETDGVAVAPLLTTSIAAYVSTDLGSVGKKDGDLSGPLTVAALIEKGESRVLWFASGFMLDENYGDANGELFLSGAREICGSSPTDIPAKVQSAAGETLSMTGPQSMVMGALFTLAIPLVFVVIGAVVLIRRRRRA